MSCAARSILLIAHAPICAALLSLNTSLAQESSDVERARAAEQTRIDVIRRATQASICVFPATGGGGGSGVVVTPDGLALTNYHVVKPCGNYMHCSMPDGEIYDAVLVGLDPTGDVALIKLLGRDNFPTAVLGDSDALRVGDNCFAVGNPFLLATDFQPSVSWGIVSGVHRYQYPAGTLLEYADCIQTDAAINPGNSGGPLFNAKGQLIGINGRGSFEKRNRVNVGVGYAISINQIKLFWDHLAGGRIVDHATLGATVTSDSRGRVVVDNILQSSEGFRRGLRYDDQIISFGGRSIETVNEFKNVLGIFPKGWHVPLEFQRDGKNYSINVRLAGVHSTQQLIDMVQGMPKQKRIFPEIPKPDPKGPPPKFKMAGPKKVEIPEHAKQFIEERRGFANYYFNRTRREEIWQQFQSRFQSENAKKKWQIKGRLADATPINIVLSQQGSGIQWGDQAIVLDSSVDLGQQLSPPGSGGLLPALHLWHRMLTMGPESYGDVYYLGSLPLAVDGTTLASVLNGTYDVAESKFFFDRQSFDLVAMEMWSDPDKDPCELSFSQHATIDGIHFPRLITVEYGDSFRWLITIDEIKFSDN